MQQVIAKRRTAERARLQVIDGGANRGRATSVTAMNQHVKASAVRMTFHSSLNYQTLRPIARMLGTTEPQVLDANREYVRKLEFQVATLRAMLPPERRMAA